MARIKPATPYGAFVTRSWGGTGWPKGPKPKKPPKRNPKILGWNKEKRGMTIGYEMDGGSPLRYEIEHYRSSVTRGFSTYNVSRGGEFIGFKGTIGRAKALAEEDAALLRSRPRSNPLHPVTGVWYPPFLDKAKKKKKRRNCGCSGSEPRTNPRSWRRGWGPIASDGQCYRKKKSARFGIWGENGVWTVVWASDGRQKGVGTYDTPQEAAAVAEALD